MQHQRGLPWHGGARGGGVGNLSFQPVGSKKTECGEWGACAMRETERMRETETRNFTRNCRDNGCRYVLVGPLAPFGPSTMRHLDVDFSLRCTCTPSCQIDLVLDSPGNCDARRPLLSERSDNMLQLEQCNTCISTCHRAPSLNPVAP